MITAADFAKGNTQSTNQSTIKSKFITASSFAKNLPPPPPPTTLQKVGDFIKGIPKAIIEPVATMVARPIQLTAELLGASDESVNEFTKKHFGDWVAPTPQNAGDVYKDAGRGLQTALTGGLGGVVKSAVTGVIPSTLGKLSLTGAVEGAGFGLGASMEQGNDILSKETAQSVALGGIVGASVPVVISGVKKFFKGKGVDIPKNIEGEPRVTGFNASNPIDTPPEIIQGHINKMKGILKDPDLAATVSQDIPGMLNGLKADIVDGLNKVGFDKQASKISNIDVSKFVSLDDFTKQVSPLLKEASFNPTTVAGESILKSGTKLASEVEKLRLEKEANIRAFGSETRPNVPEAGQPPLGYINPQAFKQLPAPRGNVIELPSSGILDSQSKLRTLVPEVQEIIKTPLIKEAESFASKNDYVTYKNTETWQNTKDAIELKKQKKTFGDVWEEAHPSPESLRAPKEQKSIKLRSVKEWSTVSKTTSPIEQAPVSPKTEARSGTIYHGTKAPISSLKEADVLQYGKPNALYGQGLYVTDNPRVAEGYSITKGKGGPGKILEGSILPDVNLLNLDESLSPDVLKQLNHWTNFGNESGNPIVINGKNGQEAMKQFMNSLDGLPTSEAQDIMEGLQTSLEEMGYDGFKHTGGQITGGIPSNVSILWDGGKRKAVDKIDVAIPKTEVPTQPVVDRQPIKSALPTVKDELTNRTIERLNQEIPVDVTDDIRQYQKTTNAKQVEEIMTHNFAFQKDVALGRKQPPVGGAPATAYRAHLENLADEFANKGDTSLAEELSKTKVIDSEAGASLQATQIASKDSLTAILSDVRNQMVKKIPRGDIQLSKLTDDLKIKIAATKQAKPTRQILKVILDNIKC